MSHNTLPTVAELSGEMRERLAKVKYVFTDLDATMLAPVAADLRAAGLTRLNVSLDTLRPARYRAITRTGELTDALAGLRAAREAGFTNTKINCVLMGGVNKLVEMGFEVLTDAGYQPEIAYFEVCHELKMLVDLMNEGGLNKARWSCSDTAQYGDYTNTCIDEHVRERMQYNLKRIQDGSFAKEFIDDQDAGAPKFKALQEEYSNVRIETVGPKLRAMFSWNKDAVKDADEANSFTGKIARAQVQ